MDKTQYLRTYAFFRSRPFIQFKGKFHIALVLEAAFLFERWEYVANNNKNVVITKFGH